MYKIIVLVRKSDIPELGHGAEVRACYPTALNNHMRVIFEEMSSWTALTMYLGMKTTFYTKYIYRKYVRVFIMKT